MSGLVRLAVSLIAAGDPHGHELAELIEERDSLLVACSRALVAVEAAEARIAELEQERAP